MPLVVRLSAEAREEALHRIERATAWPMLFLAVAIIPIIVVPLVVKLSPRSTSLLLAADWLIWAAFAIEYIIRAFIAPRKWHFFSHNVIDFVVVAIPFAQPLRLLRSVRVLRVLRATRVAAFAGKGAKEGRALFSRENFSYAILVGSLAILGGAALVLVVEKDASTSNIRSFPDAIWWAISTVATVGYGDKYPVTAEGRAIAIVLMLLGIGLFGLIAATLSSFFVEQHTKNQLDEVVSRLEAIERALVEAQAAAGNDPVGYDTGRPTLQHDQT
jgi:voltage-gated potassium channel